MKKSKVIFLALLACAFGASARTVSSMEAKRAAGAWVHRGRTLGARFPSETVENAVAHTTTNGATFYTVKMANGGTVFLSGDTTVEPILGFTSDTKDFSTLDENGPLWALLNADVSSRQPQSRQVLKMATLAAATQQTSSNANEQKWAELVAEGETLPVRSLRLNVMGSGVPKVGDLRVEPLVKSKWDQGVADGKACYNYYTPHGYKKFNPGDKDNAVCGCVATAMAQIMRYWEFPKGEVEPVTKECSWAGRSMALTMQGGTYDWAKMTLDPENEGVEEENCQAIGKLTSDCGISVGMNYGTAAGSAASTGDVPGALKDIFGYASVEWKSNGGNLPSGIYSQVLYANFDAGCPVEMSIYGSEAGGHAIVGDGYGFNAGKPYIHLNMGWSGEKDMWYNVPDIDTDWYKFNVFSGVAYNIFPETTGKILSGRIVDDEGAPVADAVVTVYESGESTAKTNMTTKGNGIFAFILPGGKSYDIVATSADGELVNDELVGLELAGENSWGNEVCLFEPTVRIVRGGVTNEFASLDRALLNATYADDVVEILQPTVMRRSVALAENCTIVATNDNPAASAVDWWKDAQIEVPDGVALTVSNVVFATEDAKTVVVGERGELRVGGYCDIEAVETASADNLVVVSALTYPFAVDCVGAKVDGTFAKTGLDLAEAEPFANLLLNYNHTRKGGEAYQGETGVLFRWKYDAPVPIEKAGGQLDLRDGVGLVNYRSLTDIFGIVCATNRDAEIVVRKDAPFTNYLNKAHNYVIRGEGASRPELAASGTSGFVVDAGGSLTISNVVFKGYRDADTTDKFGFIYVNGGDLTLDAFAELNDIEGRVCARASGVIDLMRGTVTMRPDAAIVNCASREGYATGDTVAGGYGGAIYTYYDSGCTLNLEGGTISNCYAAAYGGGVFVDDWNGRCATVKISGPLIVTGNHSGTDDGFEDNIRLYTDKVQAHSFLAANLFGKVGIRYGTGFAKKNNLGEDFLVNQAGLLDPATLGSFVNDVNGSLEAATNAANDRLVWKKKVDDGQCAPGEAKAYLIDAAGKTNYYASVQRAFEYMKSSCVVEVLPGDALKGFVTVPAGCDVTLKSAAGAVSELKRDGDFGFVVPAGTSLTLTNVCVSGKGDVKAYQSWLEDGRGMRSKPLFDVPGGQLELQAGASVCDVYGFGNRASGAIEVYEGGAFAMSDGALICRCTNVYVSAENELDYSVGAGLLVDGKGVGDVPSVAYLAGGAIRDCFAWRGSAVFVSNGAEVHVSGTMRVEIDEPDRYNDFVVQDSSALYLDDVTDGVFNMADGVNGPQHDTNLIGRVTWQWAGNLVALTNSAARFVHGASGDVGTAVTNLTDETDTLLVWCGAVRGGQLYTNLAGKVYAPVADVSGLLPVLPPVALPELSATAGEGDVAAALADSNLVDPSVAKNIRTLAAYNAFREWAQNVVGGVDAVVKSERAGDSYKFGTTALLKSADAPTVEMTGIERVDEGLAVSVVVKDGEDPIRAASAAVAKMFEATDDLSDWEKHVDLTVKDAQQNADNSIRFTVAPAGGPSKVFIRLKY